MLFECYVFTKFIQSDQITLSEFFSSWTQMKLKLKKNAPCELLTNLLKCIDDRQKRLLENASILSALYLDPRYRKVLNNDTSSKQIAVNHLTRLWKRVQEILKTTEPEQTVESNNSRPDYVEDEFDAYLNLFEGTNLPQINLQSNDIMTKLQTFDKVSNEQPRLPRSNNIHEYWEKKKRTDPELFLLASIIYGAASTQTSVERAFSALAFILNRYRCNLSDENLEDILFIRLHKTLFYEVISEM